MRRFVVPVLTALLLMLSSAWAQGPDEQYVRIYNLIQEGDAQNNNGAARAALAKYSEAQGALLRFQKNFPQWNVRVVEFRLNYLSSKIAVVAAKIPAGTTPSPGPGLTAPATTSPAGPTPGDWAQQVEALKNLVRQLEDDKGRLESKLKEALSARPATSDPRALARAEERIKALERQNSLLRVTLSQEKAKPAGADPRVLAQTTEALAEANRKLAAQTEKANSLAQEKQFLQNKLALLAPIESNTNAVEATRKALADANRQLSEQKQLAARLSSEKDSLQAQIRSLSSQSEADSLREENRMLKKQLADLKTATSTPGRGADPSLQLAQAQAQIAALQSDKDMLRLEKAALESRLKQSGPVVTTAVLPAPGRTQDATRVQQLERERDDLQARLETALRELYGRKGRPTAARIDDMENQLAALRARLSVFEARKVPYSSEELALFRGPDPKLADPHAGQKRASELPAGTVALVAEAQRFYATKQLDKAEEKYLQVLQQDKKNVPTLANLAAIQLDRDHLDAAETNIRQAIALAPGDAYSLLVLGRLRLRQQKIEEAVDALSRAAKLDPEDAQIQNFLGLALNQKGLREPAETALRRALQLNPTYGNAHNNLAVMYLSQKPPSVALATWHYQKALAAGFPRNPELEKMMEARKPIE